MKIHQIFTNSSYRNFSYIIEYSGKAICVDPFYPRQILDFLTENSLQLVSIVNTHEHGDHTCGNDGVQKATNCEIWAHHNAKGKIQGVTRFLKKDDIIELDSDSYIKVMDTPGHTFAHLCLLLVENEKPIAVITGDTLFNAGVGNCYNGGDSSELYETIAKQFHTLPDDVKVYPGHEYWENNLEFTKSIENGNEFADKILKDYRDKLGKDDFLVSTIGLERKVNVFFRLNVESIQTKIGESNEKQVFLKLREMRDSW